MKYIIVLFMTVCVAQAQSLTRLETYTAATADRDTLTISQLIGATDYTGWYCQVAYNANSPGNAPHGETVRISAFTATTGRCVFTSIEEGATSGTNAFSANVEQNDVLYIFPPDSRRELISAQGIPTFPAAAAPANGVSIAEVLRSVWQGAGWSFLEVATGPQSTDSTWSSVGTHEVFDVTGEVEFLLMIKDSVDYTGADSIIVEIGANKVTAMAKVDWDAGEFVGFPQVLGTYRVENVTIANAGSMAEAAGAKVFRGWSNGIDIGYEIQTASAPAGISIWRLWWRPKPGGTGTVAAGAGGAL